MPAMTSRIHIDERRAFGRRSTDMPARVRAAGIAQQSCTIRDISEGGALLEFASPPELLPRVWLCLSDGTDVLCDVRHARGNRVGVQFAGGAPPVILRHMVEPADPATRVPERAVADPDRAECSRMVAEVRRAMTAALKVATTSLVAK